jgi:hypothetical protein
LAAILAQWRRHPVASTKALDLLHWVMHAVLYRRIAVDQNGQQSWSMFLSLFCLLLPWQPLEQYGVSSCPMAASSGFQGSPGHAPSGDAVFIPPKHRRGHQNGKQRKCACSSSPPFLYDNM